MEQETEKKETKVLDKLKEETDKSMKRVLEQGVQTNNVDFLYKMKYNMLSVLPKLQ